MEQLHEHFLKTTVTGLNLVFIFKNVFCKAFWAAIVIISFTATILIGSTCFGKYYNYPNLVVTTLNYKDLKFPAVTFCNLNAIVKSKVPQTGSPIGTLIDAIKTVQSSNLTSSRRKRQAVIACLPGWIVAGNFCYMIQNATSSHIGPMYSHAKDACVNTRSRLPILNTLQDFNDFWTALNQSNVNATSLYVFVGAVAIGNTSTWVWSNDGSAVLQTNSTILTIKNSSSCLIMLPTEFQFQEVNRTCTSMVAKIFACQKWRLDVPQPCRKIHRFFYLNKRVHHFSFNPIPDNYFIEETAYGVPFAFEHNIEQVTEPVYALTNPSHLHEKVYYFGDSYKSENVSLWLNQTDIAFYVPSSLTNLTIRYDLVFDISDCIRPVLRDSLFALPQESFTLVNQTWLMKAAVPFFNSSDTCANYCSSLFVTTTTAITTETTSTKANSRSVAEVSYSKLTAATSSAYERTTSRTSLESPTSSTSSSTTTAKTTTTTMGKSSQASTVISLTDSTTTGPNENSDQLVQFENLLLSSYKQMEQPVAMLSTAQEDLVYITSQFNDSYRSSIGFTLADLMRVCTYAGKICESKNFQMTYNPVYGNCYSYSPDNNLVSKAGRDQGLRIIVNVNQSEYLPSSISSGLRIVMHDINETIFPDTEGFNLSPGKFVSFSMSFTTKSKLPKPYSNCQTMSGNKTYSVEGCMRECKQNVVTKTCGCGDPMLRISNGSLVCDIHKKQCVFDTETKGIFNAISCNCPPACLESNYKPVMTSSNLIESSSKLFCQTQNDEKCKQNWQENIVYFEVYYSQLSSKTLAETPAYDIYRFLSDIANYSGLLIGISMISLFEVVPLLFLIFSIVFRSVDNVLKPLVNLHDLSE